MHRSMGSFLALIGLLIVVLGAFTNGAHAMTVGLATILTGLVVAVDTRTRP